MEDPGFLAERSRSEFAEVEKLFFEFFKPKPIPFEHVRLGGNQDGAYLLPNDLSGIQACFSPGVADFKSFEDELAHSFGIKSHMVDYSTDVGQLRTPLIPGLQTLDKLWLSDHTSGNSISLSDWIEKWEPQKEDFLLQMDIEGGEYPVLEVVSEDVLRRFRVISMELHNVRTQLSEFGLESPLVRLIKKMSRTFLVTHVHPVNVTRLQPLPGGSIKIPEIFEVSLLNVERVNGHGNEGKFYPPMVPHRLDIASTFPHKTPVFFPRGWSMRGQFPLGWNIRLLAWLRYFVTIIGDLLNRRIPKRISRVFHGMVDPVYILSRRVLKNFFESRGEAGQKK